MSVARLCQYSSTILWATGGLSCILVIVAVVMSVDDPKDVTRRDDVTLADVQNFIIKNINPDNIRRSLRHLTLEPHLGGTDGELGVARWVAQTWQRQGLDQVHLVPYKVLLSYPDPLIPNLVRIVDDEGSAAWVSAAKQKALYAPEEASPELPFTFLGYAPRGNVTGDVVYAYYGREEDFHFLAEEGIDLSGKIVIARYGQIFRANIVRMAEERGALGVVVYSDPADYAPAGPDFVYPHSSYMPPSASPFGTVKLGDGDPLTPFYPSIESAFRIPEEEASMPKIPAQSISYDDACQILSRMGGAVAPASWQGNLNLTYRIGPGLAHPGWKVNVDVNNNNTQTTTYNVVGVITGHEEPDRYVILGNHLDAWLFGGLDPNSGTAAMLELSRVFAHLRNETGWRPRRSLVFCGWGAEEYMTVGSTEWTQQFAKQLSDKAVAYLNVDMAIEGNYTLRTKSSPLLADAVFESAKKIPNPDPVEVMAGRKNVYATWAARRPDPLQPDTPLLQAIGSGSDYKGFQHNLGIPCMDTRYTHDNRTIGEPMYHTLYETFAVVDEIYDKGFHFHSAVAAMWGDLAVVLSESKVLPFSLVTYAAFIQRAQDHIAQRYGELIQSQNITLKYFTDAGQMFNTSVFTFNKALESLDLKSPLAVRRVNDQLMMVERAFIDPRGLPGQPELNHVVTAPSKNDAYSGTAFAGLVDTLADIEEAAEEDRPHLWRTFAEHLAAVTHLIETAAKVLSDDLW
ncbi:putative N-acetylated-alpha-linked acidic dipeptidase [Procambarus clarkii]|uniref:putative N-acetylated-alpha-linked acidic dipeptidase n=1 Tax=Procambarus clarkii TaxID=6728 RepID=UPI003742D01C